jgi:hypothetical protein
MNPGDKQGKLTFLKSTGFLTVPSGHRRGMGLFRCDCGKEKEVCISNVKRGVTNSCGCIALEKFAKVAHTRGKQKASYVHGLFGTKFHRAFYGVVTRCNKQKSPSYRFYGACGIRCEWTDFLHFKEDMYQSYLEHISSHGTRQTTIERIDSKGNYSKDNCRWATYAEQGKNRKNNLELTINGETMILADWVRKLGISSFKVKKLAARSLPPRKE